MNQLEKASNMLLAKASLLNQLSKLELQKGCEARAPWLSVRWRDGVAGTTTRELLEMVDFIRQATARVVLNLEVV